MFENTIHAYLAVAGIALAIYVWLIIVLRFAGKRALAKLNAFDFAVTIAFGSILSTAILSPDVDWAMGAVGLAMLALLQYIVAQLSVRFPHFHDLVRSQPTALVRDGKMLTDVMKHERVSRGEVEAAMRGKGLGSVTQAAAVVLESDGTLSVIKMGEGPIDLLP